LAGVEHPAEAVIRFTIANAASSAGRSNA
jgi:hypothetical protein